MYDVEEEKKAGAEDDNDGESNGDKGDYANAASTFLQEDEDDDPFNQSNVN